MELLVWLVPSIGNLDVGIVMERRRRGLVTFIHRPMQAQCWGGVLVMKKRNTVPKRRWERRWDFPGNPAVRTPHFHCQGHRFSP